MQSLNNLMYTVNSSLSQHEEALEKHYRASFMHFDYIDNHQGFSIIITVHQTFFNEHQKLYWS